MGRRVRAAAALGQQQRDLRLLRRRELPGLSKDSPCTVQLDREYITKNFVGASGARSLRDGIGFLRWVESFFDISKEQAQINIPAWERPPGALPHEASVKVISVSFSKGTGKILIPTLGVDFKKLSAFSASTKS